MSDDVTLWIEKLSAGDPDAAHVIWDQYFDRLVRLARRKFDGIGISRRAADEEDVALSAMHSFYRRAVDGQFELGDRQELWKLLVTITIRKAYAELKRQKTKKRGEGLVRGESVFMRKDDQAMPTGIGQVLGDEPTPELALMAAESCEFLLDHLQDETLVQVARMKLDGYTNEEVAEKLECVPRTVERKLNRIREKWSDLLESLPFDEFDSPPSENP